MEKCGSAEVCFAVSGWSLCVMPGFGWLSLDTSHSTVELLSSAVVLR